MSVARLRPTSSRLLTIVVLAVSALGGCGDEGKGGGSGATERTTDSVAEPEEPPSLDLRRPARRTRKPRISIEGTTITGSEVTVEGRRVDTVPISDTDGELSRFEATVALRLGRNVIDVEATYDGSPPARRRIRVTRSAAADLTVSRPWDGATTNDCHPAYVGACIPRDPPGGDVNCPDIPDRNFGVRSPGNDPYDLDGNEDGIACET